MNSDPPGVTSTKEPPSRLSEEILTSEVFGNFEVAAHGEGHSRLIALRVEIEAGDRADGDPGKADVRADAHPFGTAEVRGERIALAAELDPAGLPGVDDEADRGREHDRADHGLGDAVRHRYSGAQAS